MSQTKYWDYFNHLWPVRIFEVIFLIINKFCYQASFRYPVAELPPLMASPCSPLLGLSNDCEKMMQGSYSDVTVTAKSTMTTGTKVFNLHKIVLSSEWTFFSDVIMTTGTNVFNMHKIVLSSEWTYFFLTLPWQREPKCSTCSKLCLRVSEFTVFWRYHDNRNQSVQPAQSCACEWVSLLFSDVTMTTGTKVFNMHNIVLSSEWTYFFLTLPWQREPKCSTCTKLCLRVSELTFFWRFHDNGNQCVQPAKSCTCRWVGLFFSDITMTTGTNVFNLQKLCLLVSGLTFFLCW